jgi:hypothetical protein
VPVIAAAPVYTGRQRANLDAFAASQPAAYGWLMANAGSNEFAASLLNGCARYGGLTPRQLACVVRNLDGAADRPAIVAPLTASPSLPSDSAIGFVDPIPAADYGAPATVAPVAPSMGAALPPPTPNPDYTGPRPLPVEPVMVNLDRVRTAMELASASGLRRVRLTFGAVTMKLSGPTFRSGAGMILCYFNGSYCGVVDTGNVFRSRYGTTVTLDALDAFRAVGADPQAAARTHGQDTGHCACCRRLLTDPVSVMANIGPVCARRFGWSF